MLKIQQTGRRVRELEVVVVEVDKYGPPVLRVDLCPSLVGEVAVSDAASTVHDRATGKRRLLQTEHLAHVGRGHIFV